MRKLSGTGVRVTPLAQPPATPKHATRASVRLSGQRYVKGNGATKYRVSKAARVGLPWKLYERIGKMGKRQVVDQVILGSW